MKHVKALLVVSGLMLAGCTPGLSLGGDVSPYFLSETGTGGGSVSAALPADEASWAERHTLGDTAPRGDLGGWTGI